RLNSRQFLPQSILGLPSNAGNHQIGRFWLNQEPQRGHSRQSTDANRQHDPGGRRELECGNGVQSSRIPPKRPRYADAIAIIICRVMGRIARKCWDGFERQYGVVFAHPAPSPGTPGEGWGEGLPQAVIDGMESAWEGTMQQL